MITIALLVLLSLLAVGLLSLSTITLRSSGSADAIQAARNNARVALMLAIGQLQKSAGSDQNITAPANLVDSSYPLGFTGVWESWQPGEEGQDYEGKEDRFKGWLSSAHFGQSNVATSDEPGSGTGGGAPIELIGDGTLADRPNGTDDDARVVVDSILFDGEKSDGRMAWVTVDESVKSRINLAEEVVLPSPARELAMLGAPATDGIAGLRDFANFDSSLASVGRMISNASVDLALNDDAMGRHTPDLTVWSASLLTNPVAGGLKKDLSTLFRNGVDAAGNGTLYETAGLPTGDSDPSFSLLGSYHDLYKLIGSTVSSVRPAANGIAASMPSRYTAVGRGGAGARPQTLEEPLLVPSLLRVDMIFSLIARRAHGGWYSQQYPYLLHMTYLPVVTLHNPYNVPLSFEAMRVGFEDIPMGFQININGAPLTNRLIPINGLTVGAGGSTGTTKSFGVTLKSEVGGARGRSEPITLLPGQTQIFGTPKVPPTWTWADENAGQGADGIALFDWRSNQTAEFEMAPGMISDPTTLSGFDIDWLAPTAYQTEAGRTYGRGAGVVHLTGNELVGVTFGPATPSSARGSFQVTMDLVRGGRRQSSGSWNIRYGDAGRLQEIVQEGTSVRYDEPRNFPETYPDRAKDRPIRMPQILEPDNRALRDYVMAKPFALFSLSGKTTRESFIPNRPYADSTPAIHIVDMDLSSGGSSPGDLPLEMVMMPIRNGSAAIEEVRGTDPRNPTAEGFFFGGHGSLNGTPRATFWEVPEAPLQSVAQFRHAPLSGVGFGARNTYTVGESLANPLLGTGSVEGSTPGSGAELLDHKWLSNAALWDGYFLSTIVEQAGPSFQGRGLSAAQLADGFFAGTEKLMNPRLQPVRANDPNAAAALAASDGWLRAAAHMMTRGGFNVNSTSVEAWTAVLSALRASEVLTGTGLTEAEDDSAALPRVRRPAEESIDNAVVNTPQRFWQGFRELDDGQIEELAELLVDEIRNRGPFLSLSEFVNRRIGGEGDERTHKGAIQATIDRTDINDIALTRGLDLNAQNSGPNNYASPTVAYGPNAVHAPGALSQGDVLTAIGSHVTVRGDTFLIRTYGDALDSSGNVLARAWCEAVVQRVPEFVDPNDSPELEIDDLNLTNERFGRRFELVSLRWLSPEEV